MVFKLVRADPTDLDQRKIQLVAGTHLFGRGVFLDCNDKRVSRKHGQLEVTDSSVLMKALHRNPCFYTKKGSTEVTIIQENCTIVLNNGDKFGLLPNSYWYELLNCLEPLDIQSPNPSVIQSETRKKTEVVDDEQSDPTTHTNMSESNGNEQPDHCETTITNGPEVSNDNEENVATTNSNISEVDNCKDQENVQDENDASNESEILDFNVSDVENNVEADRTESPVVAAFSSSQQSDTENLNTQSYEVKKEPITPKRAHSEERNDVDTKRIKTEPDQIADIGDMGAGPSNANAAAVKNEPPPSPAKPANVPVRERCMYGAQCYRRNPQHKAQFSHPTDSDWGPGEKGVCPYGASCMRRDPRHWTSHDHPPGAQPPPPGYRPGKRNRKKRRAMSGSDSDVSSKQSEVLPEKRVRKTVKRDGLWSESEPEEEDPFMSDGSDEWTPGGADTETPDYV